MLLDNQTRRTFVSADVNTVVALLSPPDESRVWGLDQLARFILFKVPFEHVLSPVVFEEIEATKARRTVPEYQIYPVNQKVLLEDGCELPTQEGNEGTAPKRSGKPSAGPLMKFTQYIGNKWGGKYLRASEIYWTILERNGGKLVRLGNIAKVQFGIKTGANQFFYLDEARIQEWKIEKKFLKPAILRPAEIVAPEVRPEHLSFSLLVVDKPRTELKGTRVEQYIRWGESQGFHRTATCAARGRGSGEWYRLQARAPASLVLPIMARCG